MRGFGNPRFGEPRSPPSHAAAAFASIDMTAEAAYTATECSSTLLRRACPNLVHCALCVTHSQDPARGPPGSSTLSLTLTTPNSLRRLSPFALGFLREPVVISVVW